jgi:hypothetical protein
VLDRLADRAIRTDDVLDRLLLLGEAGGGAYLALEPSTSGLLPPRWLLAARCPAAHPEADGSRLASAVFPTNGSPTDRSTAPSRGPLLSDGSLRPTRTGSSSTNSSAADLPLSFSVEAEHDRAAAAEEALQALSTLPLGRLARPTSRTGSDGGAVGSGAVGGSAVGVSAAGVSAAGVSAAGGSASGGSAVSLELATHERPPPPAAEPPSHAFNEGTSPPTFGRCARHEPTLSTIISTSDASLAAPETPASSMASPAAFPIGSMASPVAPAFPIGSMASPVAPAFSAGSMPSPMAPMESPVAPMASLVVPMANLVAPMPNPVAPRAATSLAPTAAASMGQTRSPAEPSVVLGHPTSSRPAVIEAAADDADADEAPSLYGGLTTAAEREQEEAARLAALVQEELEQMAQRRAEASQ